MGISHQLFDQIAMLSWGLPCALSLLLLLLLWRTHRAQHYPKSVLSLQLILLLCVFAIAHQFAQQRLVERLDAEVQTRQLVEGVVYIDQISEGKFTDWRQPARLLLPDQKDSLKIFLYPQKVYSDDAQVVGIATEPFQLGKFYRVTLDIRPPHGYANAGGFDQEKWLLQQGIQGTATVKFSQEIAPQDVAKLGWYHFVFDQEKILQQWRLWVEKRRLDYRQALLGDVFTTHSDRLQPTSIQQASTDLPSIDQVSISLASIDQASISQDQALLLGLLTGDRGGINSATTTLYQQMGISHLLAISGPHVLILAAMACWVLMQMLHLLMRYCGLSQIYLYCSRQQIYIPIFLGIVTFYVAFTGFEIPAMRTWIMAMLCGGLLWCRWALSPFTVLLLAAVLISLWDSFAVLSAAFWLSFLASAILLLIYQQLQQQSVDTEQSLWCRLKIFFQILWSSQWRIFIVLIPVLLWQFKALPLISPVINLFAIPFLSLIIVPLDIIAACIWPLFPAIAQGLWSFIAGLMGGFNSLLELLLPLAEWGYRLSFLTGLQLIGLSCAIALLFLPRGLIPRYWSLLFLIPLLLPKPQSQLQLDILDVGQGQAIVVRTQQHRMLIDTGAAAWQSDQASMGEKVIVPFLQHYGMTKLDEILLSHLDRDHSGGTADVIRHIHTAQLRANAFDAKLTHYPDVPFVRCEREQQWRWDGVEIKILSPVIDLSTEASSALSTSNESSCVVLISTQTAKGPFRVLIMGDAGWETEYHLLQQYPDLHADVLVLGHHGSKHSSAYDFLAQISPQLAVISVGKYNRYGHPASETLLRLRDLNIPEANTAELGGISIHIPDADTSWTWSYQRAKRLWLQP